MTNNYEEKYKQALERARESYKKSIEQGWTCDKEIYEQIFPELSESEDERIRKGLIEHLKELKEQSVEGSHLKRPEHYDAWLAWLEKQGKQNSTPKFKIGDTIHKIGENTVFPRTIEKIEDGDYVCNNSHSFVNIKFQDDYELVEQKSANKVEPRFEVGDCIRYRGDNYKIKDIETTKNGFIYNVAVIGKPSDPEEVKTAIGIAAEKDIVKIEQSSTDWSEEDEKQIRQIERIVKDSGASTNLQNKISDWLKSIKPQSHWKPSEEQMEGM